MPRIEFIPHEEIVRHALKFLVHVAGRPASEICGDQDYVKKATINVWVSRDEGSLRFESMRGLILDLQNRCGVTFDATGFTYRGQSYRVLDTFGRLINATGPILPKKDEALSQPTSE